MSTRTVVRRGSIAIFAAGVAAGLASVLSACTLLGVGDGASMQGDWVLVAADDADGAFDLTPADVTLSVEGAAISGIAACNRYGSTVVGQIGDSDEQPVRFEGLFQTEMACSDDRIMQLEARYLTALGQVDSGLRIDPDTMVLLGDDVRLEFDLLIDG